MRTSHRRLLSKISSLILMVIGLLCIGAKNEMRAQDLPPTIPGLPGSTSDAARGLGVSDNKLGSVLFFNYYTSDALSSQVDTRISITNANPVQDVALHLFYVDSINCFVIDSFLCLTRNQTVSFNASDFDPNVTGYLMAIAVDSQGRPMSFNYLAGDELVIAPTGHRFGLSAMAAARRDGNFSAPINDDGASATLFFNGDQYDFLPYGMVLDNFPSQISGVGSALADTRLYVYSPVSNLITGENPFSGTLVFLVFDDQEKAHSSTLPLNCYLSPDKQRVSSIRTTPTFNSIIPAGHSGWLRFYAIGSQTVVGDPEGCKVTLTNAPLMGATATRMGNYTGGHNLNYATTFNAPGYSITIPVIVPPCGPATDLPDRGSSLCALLNRQ